MFFYDKMEGKYIFVSYICHRYTNTLFLLLLPKIKRDGNRKNKYNPKDTGV